MTSVRPDTPRSLALITLVLASLILTVPQSATAGDAGAATRMVPSPKRGEAVYATGTVVMKIRAGFRHTRDAVTFGIGSIDDVMMQIGATRRTPLFPNAPFARYEPSSPNGADDTHAGFDRVYVVSYDGPFDAKWVSDRLVELTGVEYAEPYYIFTTDAMPVNDPQAAQQYWLSIIKAQEAWDVTQGSTDVVIAIVDSGVDWAHEDLAENIWENPGETGTDAQGKDRRTNNTDDDQNGYVDDWHGWDFVGNASFSDQMSRVFRPDNNPAPRAVNIQGYSGSHGTTVAGCAAARTNNGRGIASPGYNSRILAVKAAADSSINAINAGYEGIVYAADMRANIINCSFGGAVNGGSQALQQIADYAKAQGCLVIAASGNNGQNVEAVPHLPAGLNGVMSVGATSASDYADTSYTNSGLGVHVYAPGTNVLTTFPGNRYVSGGVTGTSFSSPIVSGVAALVAAMHPSWSPEQIVAQLRVTGDRVKINPARRFAPHFYRRVNAQRAVLINRSLTSGQRFPGIALERYTMNGRARDTVRSLTGTVTVQLQLKNLLAPTVNLTIDTWPGQMLRASSATSVPVIETNGTATAEVQLEIDPESAERFSDGSFDLVLRLRDGEYEDLIPVRIPVRLDGWRQQAAPGGASAVYATQSIAAASPVVAWAVANINEERPTFARTIDGRNWQTFRNITSTNEQVYCVEAIDDKLAWAGSGPSSGSAGIFRTVNGGTAWTRTSVSSITPFVNAVHFFDENNGVFIGDPRNGRWGIGLTSDGGATWTPTATALAAGSGEAGWNNSFTAYGDNLWFGTNNNRIFRSSDRGRTWTSSQTPSTSSFSLAFTSPNDGIAIFKRTFVGGSLVGANMTAVTRNGGATWQTVTLPFGSSGDAAAAIPGTSRILVSTESGILETSDLGATWKVLPAPATVFNWKANEVGVRVSPGMQLTAAAAGADVGAYGVNNTGRIIGMRELAPAAAPIAGERTSRASMLEPFPNPTDGATTLAFELAHASDVTFELFDARGARVRTLLAERRDAGRHAVVVDAADLVEGSYHAVLTVAGERVARTVVIAR